MLSVTLELMARGGNRHPKDANEMAFDILQIVEGKKPKPEPPKAKNPAAVALGAIGGAARKKALTPERRAEIAKKAAAKRWGKKNR